MIIDPNDPTATVNGLPLREMQCLMGLARGLSTIEIGKELYLSPHSIKTYLSRLYRRIGARSQAHAVAIAYERGLLPVRVTDVELDPAA